MVPSYDWFWDQVLATEGVIGELERGLKQAGGHAANETEREAHGQEHRPGNPQGRSAQTALSSFDSLFTALHSAYGDNPTMRNFASWILQRYERADELRWREVSELVNRLITKSKTADGEPAAFFIGAVKKSPEDGGFGYRPKGTSR